MHSPSIQEEDVEMKLKPPRNGLLATRISGMHYPKMAEQMTLVQYALTFFYYSLLIIKILK
jgi:hypothetical protein